MRWRILSIAAWFATLCGVGTLALWLMGRAESDHWEWSQYLYWQPTPLVLVVSGFQLTIGIVLARLAGRVDETGAPCRRRPCARTRLAASLLWAGVLSYMLIGEWHAARWVAPVGPPKDTPSMRVLFWNPASQTMERFSERVLSTSPDIMVITNAPWRTDWSPVREGMRGPSFTTAQDRFSLVSRFPLIRWGFTDLHLKGGRAHVAVWSGGGMITVDTGQAIFMELDTSAVTGGTTTIWDLDLPSDPDLSRWRVMRDSAAAIAGFTGPVYRRNSAGADEPEPGTVKGFPAPDLVVGDFNTPRGSESLDEIVGDMPTAFEQAGRGFGASWPRQLPILAIDQAFVGTRLRCVGFRMVDLGDGEHRAEVMDLIKGATR